MLCAQTSNKHIFYSETYQKWSSHVILVNSGKYCSEGQNRIRIYGNSTNLAFRISICGRFKFFFGVCSHDSPSEMATGRGRTLILFDNFDTSFTNKYLEGVVLLLNSNYGVIRKTSKQDCSFELQGRSATRGRQTGVERNFWPLRNFWPVIVFQLFGFSE